MALRRLTVHQLRNLVEVAFEPGPQLNIIYGENGSGKTSLLEAINLLGLGRSFRTHRPRPIINYQADALVLYGEVAEGGRLSRIGLRKTRGGETTLKVDGTVVNSAAELAARLPILCLNANSFELINGPPKPRRQLVDWLVFHVEPRFYRVWRDHQHCLKHRNNLLRRDKIDRFELASWDRQLVPLAETIDRMRSQSFARLQTEFETIDDLLPEIGTVALNYRRGWAEDQNYAEVLAAGFEQDRHRGHTHAGPHRADIQIMSGSHRAGDVLSRGQQKAVVSALVIAQGRVFRGASGRQCVYLVDDLPAELDEAHRRKLGDWLESLQTQVFITGVEKASLMSMWSKGAQDNIHAFHVKQGALTPEPTSD